MQKLPVQLDGTITFDATAEFPYRLAAKGDLGEVDATTIWPVVPEGQDPQLEGRFTLASTITGRGHNLGDLLGGTQMDFKLAGTKGIIRILKTNIADGLPQDKDPGEVSETLSGVGTLMGKLFAIEKGSGEKSVNKTTENVLNLSSIVAEIGYDSLTVTGRRSADGTIHLGEVMMVADAEKLAGSGEIAAVKGRPFAAQPLKLDLTLSVRGDVAGLFEKAGLLAGPKDQGGYTSLRQPLHFSGTLGKIDPRGWHDLLVRAATRKPSGK